MTAPDVQPQQVAQNVAPDQRGPVPGPADKQMGKTTPLYAAV